MNSLQRTLIVSISLLLGAANAANPVASWNFDDGKNIDSETGTTEFGRGQTYKFSGMKAAGPQKIQLNANHKVDTARFFVDSLRKKALRTGVDEATGKVFSAHGKMIKPISKYQGAVSMWVKPENWNGANQGKFRIFFAANDNKPARTNELLIYKNGTNNNLLFLMGDNDPKRWSQAACSIWDWKQGDWHFVAATWTPKTMTLYVDGKSYEVERKQPISQFDYELIHVGTREWKVEGGLTQIDDLMIFDKTLTKAELDDIFVKTRPIADDRKAPIEYKLGLTTPVLDGKISDFEYGAASNGTFNLKTMELTKENRWAISRDAERFYFACDTDAPTTKAKIKDRDGNLWEDESIEIHLEYKGKKWQFIINENGVFFDTLNGKLTFQAQDLQQKHSTDGKRWIFETSIPFKDLGITPQEGDRFYFTLGRSYGESTSSYTAASPVLRQFADKSNFIKVIFDKTATPVEINYIDLPGSKGNITVEAKLPGNVTGDFYLKGVDTRTRILAEKTVALRSAAEKTSATMTASGLAKEGHLVYTVTANGNDIVNGNVIYLSPDQVKVRYIRVYMKDQKLETALTLSPPVPAEYIIIQELKDKSGNLVLKNEQMLGKENSEKFNALFYWDLTTLPPGDYDYYLSVNEKGKIKPLHHQYFQKPGEKMPWTDFKEGIDTVNVPEPWKTPVAEGSVLKCSYQEYDFSGSLLPRQIKAKGNELLSAPVQLRINGKTVSVPAKLKILEKNTQSVKFQTSGSYDKFNFTVEGYVEYDGFLNMNLTYSAKNPGDSELKDLALVIPMKPEFSKLFFNYKPGDVQLSGSLANGYTKDLSSHPVFWVGDADYGLYWGADSMRGTRIKNTERSLVITPARNGKGAVSTVRLVDTPFRMLGNKRSIEFSFQATPVKDVKFAFNEPWMFRGGDTLTLTDFHKIFNYYNPEYLDEAVLKHYVQAAKKRTKIYGFYSCIYGISPFCPEWPWHQEKWISSPPGPGMFKQDFPLNDEEARNRGYWAFGCVNEPEFMNWQLYWLYLLLTNKDYGVKDLYFDMAYPRACDNPIHGCGWKDDFGVKRMTYPIKANREFTKRIRKIMLDKDPTGALMYHPSGEPLPPMYGLVDFVYDGEIFVSQVGQEENYYNIFTPELVQSSFTGIQSGTNAVYISQLNRSAVLLNPGRSAYWRQKVLAPAAMKAVRHFLGYCLVHNMRPAAGVAIYETGAGIEKMLYSLGLASGNYKYIPYWRKDCPVKTNAPVLLSVFSFPGKMLAVIMNNNDKVVKVNMNRPAGYSGKIYDLENNAVLNGPSVDVNARDYRLVVFEEK